MFGRTTRLLAVTVTLAVLGLIGGSSAQSASAQTISNDFGTLKVSKVTGSARHGNVTFAGHYNVHRFVTTPRGHVKAVGRLTGTLTKKNGNTERVAERVRMPVRLAASSVSAAPAASGTASVSQTECQVLDLVLGPLDLDLLGLQVHLDRVHLNITAVPGAGNLLGNLLCAVAGLLDNTQLANLGTILANVLNAILGILRA